MSTNILRKSDVARIALIISTNTEYSDDTKGKVFTSPRGITVLMTAPAKWDKSGEMMIKEPLYLQATFRPRWWSGDSHLTHSMPADDFLAIYHSMTSEHHMEIPDYTRGRIDVVSEDSRESYGMHLDTDYRWPYKPSVGWEGSMPAHLWEHVAATSEPDNSTGGARDKGFTISADRRPEDSIAEPDVRLCTVRGSSRSEIYPEIWANSREVTDLHLPSYLTRTMANLGASLKEAYIKIESSSGTVLVDSQLNNEPLRAGVPTSTIKVDFPISNVFCFLELRVTSTPRPYQSEPAIDKTVGEYKPSLAEVAKEVLAAFLRSRGSINKLHKMELDFSEEGICKLVEVGSGRRSGVARRPHNGEAVVGTIPAYAAHKALWADEVALVHVGKAQVGSTFRHNVWIINAWDRDPKTKEQLSRTSTIVATNN